MSGVMQITASSGPQRTDINNANLTAYKQTCTQS